MNILAVNSGSASLKLDLMQIESPGVSPHRLAHGRVERFGPDAATDFQLGDGEHVRSTKNVLDHLARKEGLGVADLENMLNQCSGLLGVSGRSADMREVLAAAAHDKRAALAVDMFCYRARKYIGAYLAALGGAQAVVFGGGIGENDPLIRQRICEGMDWCGLALDPARNAAATGVEGRITRDDARVQAWVVPVDEAALMAEAAAECLSLLGSVASSPSA